MSEEQELKQKLIKETRIELQKHPDKEYEILEKFLEKGKQDTLDNIGDYQDSDRWEA